MEIIIEKINLNDVIKYNKIRYNTNNIWENKIKPLDYDKKIKKTNTNNWVNKFQNTYKKIIINDPDEINWMIEASMISSKTGTFTKFYQEDLELFLQKYEPIYNDIFNGTKYFVRTENVSFKFGQHGAGPYTTLRQIIESAVSCIDCHKPLFSNSSEIIIYLFNWLDIKPYNEFRIFVYNNKITAISQQDFYNDYSKIFTENKIKENCIIINNYFKLYIKNRLLDYNSYSYDFAILENNKPYFIEVNCFGKEYPAGSNLFDWVTDENILYGKKNIVYFRYTYKTIIDKFFDKFVDTLYK